MRGKVHKRIEADEMLLFQLIKGDVEPLWFGFQGNPGTTAWGAPLRDNVVAAVHRLSQEMASNKSAASCHKQSHTLKWRAKIREGSQRCVARRELRSLNRPLKAEGVPSHAGIVLR